MNLAEEQKMLAVFGGLRRLVANMERRIRALEALTEGLGTEEHVQRALAILKETVLAQGEK